MEIGKRYRWMNVAVLIVSMYALATSQWAGAEFMVDPPRQTLLASGWASGALRIGGIAGVAAVFTSLRSATLGRLLAGFGGLVVLSGFFAIPAFSSLAILSFGGTALVLLAAAFFLGPIPTPEDEGKRR